MAGTVQKTSEDSAGVKTVYLETGGGLSVVCGIPDDMALKLQQGQKATLQGKGSGKLGDDITVSSCVLVE